VTFPVDGEFAGLIDDGLDAQDQAEFVVHFESLASLPGFGHDFTGQFW
jgi:hypothetical protein